jgi:hypothetical protein
VTANGEDKRHIGDALHSWEGVRSAPQLTKEDGRAVTGWLTEKRIRRRCENVVVVL